MDLHAFRSLLTGRGQQALRDAQSLAPREEDFLAHLQRLRRQHPEELARAALEIAILRGEASVKFPFADRLYFTRAALEQASPYEVASYRAGRFRGFRLLADLGCSVGGDTLALAAAAPTVGVDMDPLRLAMARENLRALGLQERAAFVRADLARSLPLGAAPETALFFDPARRAGGRRVFSVRAYLPPLSAVSGWLERFPAVGVKVSPGVDLEELRPYAAEVEFISLRGALKEAVLWFGPLRSAGRRATVLPGPHTLSEAPGAGDRSQPPEAHPLPLDEPRAFLYEPDPAVMRAGLVAALGEQLQAAQLDPQIAYLTADRLTPTPFARAWAVEAWFPFQVKRLREYLRARRVGRVVVKKRGSPLEPQALMRALRLEGEAERCLFLTHLAGRPIVVVAHPQAAE